MYINILYKLKKKPDYELFKQIVSLMDKKQHLNNQGLQKIIKGAMNRGVSKERLEKFPNTSTVSRPLVNIVEINPYWLAGWFFLYIKKTMLAMVVFLFT